MSVWLVTWIAATAGFLSIPGVATFAREWRVARRAGVAHPAVFVAGRVAEFFCRRRPASPGDVPNGKVFVEWDVRWLAAGAGLAVARPDARAVALFFETAQSMGIDGTTFTFEPRFRRGTAVHGVIRVADLQASAVVRVRGV